MGDFLLNDKAELAFVSTIKPAVLAAGLDPGMVVAGKAYDLKIVPIVICESSGEGEEEPKGSGNFWLDISVQVKTPAFLTDPASQVDPKTSGELIVKTVFGTLQVDNLPSLLSGAIADFYVFDNAFLVGSPQRSNDDSGIWTDSITVKIYCCGIDLS